MTKRLVLFTGGLKSAFLAELARREGAAVLLYFNLANRALPISQIHQLHTVATAVGYSESLIQDIPAAPQIHDPLNKLLFLVLHALPIARANGCTGIYHGFSKDDDTRIFNVMEAYVKQLSDLIELGQPLYDFNSDWLGGIEIETPLRRLDRRRVIRLGNEFSIPWELTSSCELVKYNSPNRVIHCGKCQSCEQRHAAFVNEGHEDPTYYERNQDEQ